MPCTIASFFWKKENVFLKKNSTSEKEQSYKVIWICFSLYGLLYVAKMMYMIHVWWLFLTILNGPVLMNSVFRACMYLIGFYYFCWKWLAYDKSTPPLPLYKEKNKKKNHNSLLVSGCRKAPTTMWAIEVSSTIVILN